MKIVFLDEATVGNIPAIEQIRALGEYTAYDYTSNEDTISRIDGADVVITNKVIISREVMEQCDNLKLICVAATGMNNIDMEAAKERRIVVKNVAGYSTESVVQITFSLLFELLSHTSQYNKFIHSGDYSKSHSFTCITPSFNELYGMRYGIIGLGAIGRRVAEVATAFGADVLYYSTSGRNNTKDYHNTTLEELLRVSDVVSIHSPLNAATEGLIDKQHMNLMKKSAYIINVGRGGIIVEQDLADVLNAGTIAGAGLDVFTKEPLPIDNPLLSVENKSRLVMTPHIAWTSEESRERLVYTIAENIKCWIDSVE